MDELRLLREVLPEADGPAPETIAAGRAMLARQNVRTTWWKARRRAVLVVGFALGIVTATTVVAAPHGGLQVANARDLGDRAALAAERAPYTPPRPGQWVYVRSRLASGFDMNAPWKGSEGPLVTTEMWNRVDGRAVAYFSNGKLRVWDYSAPFPSNPRVVFIRGNPPRYSLRNYGTLPTGSAALLRVLRTPYPEQLGPTTDADVFGQIVGMLGDPLPPRLRAALFRLLPTLHGVTLLRDTTDVTGRPGVGFAITDDWERQVIIIDPRTYRYLGMYAYAVKDHHRGGDAGTMRKGTRIISKALLDNRIVDRPGRRS